MVVVRLAVAALALGACPAQAATVSADSVINGTDPKGHFDIAETHATFLATAGESNRLTVRSEGSQLVFGEAGLTLTAGGRCVQRTPGVASCPALRSFVDVGDGDDRVDDSVSERVDGGTGDDVLSGVGELTAGPGRDTVTARPPRPRTAYFQGRGPLMVDAGLGERDTYTGARGNDTVSYAHRATPMRIALGGAANEDELISIRSIVGGDAGNVISGDARGNRLVGGAGRDRLAGGSGGDRLFGGYDRAADVLRGGPGNDTLELGGGADRVRCGSGADVVRSLESRPGVVAVPRDCERAGFESPGNFRDTYTLRGAPTRRGRSIVVRVDAFHSSVFAGDPDAVVALWAGSRLLGHSRPVNGTGVYRVALNRAGRRLARAGRHVDVFTSESRSARDDAHVNGLRFRVR